MMLPNYDDDNDANTTTTSMTTVPTMRPVRAVHVVRVYVCVRAADRNLRLYFVIYWTSILFYCT